MHLSSALVSQRIRQGLSQEALAYEAEVERSYVSLIERGNGNPSLRVLCQLAQRLGVSLVELLSTNPAVTAEMSASVASAQADSAVTKPIRKGPKAMVYPPTPPAQNMLLHDRAVDETRYLNEG